MHSSLRPFWGQHTVCKILAESVELILLAGLLYVLPLA
jgi:hypothetical protein